jgi:gluconolactonase
VTTPAAVSPVAALADLRVLAEDLDHPESVAVAPDGAIYAGGEAGQLWRLEPGEPTTAVQVADLGGFLLGLAVLEGGDVVVADITARELRRVDPASGRWETWCASADGEPLGVPNTPLVRHDGTLLLTDDVTLDPDAEHGRLLEVPADGGDARRLDVGPFRFPNQLAAGPGDDLYVVESFRPGVAVVRAGAVVETLGLPGTVPDGVAVDRGGALAVGCYQPNRLLRLELDGTTTVVLDDPLGTRLLSPTGLAFRGEDLIMASCFGSQVLALRWPWGGPT